MKGSICQNLYQNKQKGIGNTPVTKLHRHLLDDRSFRNRSSSFSVGLPRSACAIVSIVSVFMINILASHITDQQLSIFRNGDGAET